MQRKYAIDIIEGDVITLHPSLMCNKAKVKTVKTFPARDGGHMILMTLEAPANGPWSGLKAEFAFNSRERLEFIPEYSRTKRFFMAVWKFINFTS